MKLCMDVNATLPKLCVPYEFRFMHYFMTQHVLQDCMCAFRRLRSDLSAHPRSLIRIIAGHSRDSQGSNVSSGRHRRRWLARSDVQADLSLDWAHEQFSMKCCAPLICQNPFQILHSVIPEWTLVHVYIVMKTCCNLLFI